MKTFTKIAFVDENTEEYYVGENQNMTIGKKLELV
jgi:hypothetical protein